jgi:hypothetical protein
MGAGGIVMTGRESQTTKRHVQYDTQLNPTHVASTENGFELGGTIEKIVREENAIKENFIARYLAATGAQIEDTVLCQQTDMETATIRYWCEPKSVNDQRPHAPRLPDE